MKNKLWVIRKVVRAKDILGALKKERRAKVIDVVRVIENKSSGQQMVPAIGFAPPIEDDND